MPQIIKRFVFVLVCAGALVTSLSLGLAQDVTVIAYPRIYNFPGQQLCQVDRNDRRYREFCAPQSYHPYGASGYRPFGTYQTYRPRYVRRMMPSAKIVRIDPDR